MSTPKRVRNELNHCHAVIGELRKERDQAQRFFFLERAKREEHADELKAAWQIIQVLHAARLDDQEPWPRALEWLARNEKHRPA
jgi:hypothetical protein